MASSGNWRWRSLWRVSRRLLLLDEPTAGMSVAETASSVQTIGALPRDLTLLIIEHDMDTVFALADRITVLDHGQVIADDTPDVVRNDAQVRAVYLGRARVSACWSSTGFTRTTARATSCRASRWK